MTRDLIQILEEQVEAAPGADAYHLRLDEEFADRDIGGDELDDRFENFKKDFHDAVELVSKGWGSPTFEGAADSDDFPAWNEALLLAYWQSGGNVGYIALRHDDDHSPMFIEIGALTEDEVSTLLYSK